MSLDFYHFIKKNDAGNVVFVAHKSLNRHHIVGMRQNGRFYPAEGEHFGVRGLQLITELFAGYTTSDPISYSGDRALTVNEDWLADILAKH